MYYIKYRIWGKILTLRQGLIIPQCKTCRSAPCTSRQLVLNKNSTSSGGNCRPNRRDFRPSTCRRGKSENCPRKIPVTSNTWRSPCSWSTLNALAKGSKHVCSGVQAMWNHTAWPPAVPYVARVADDVPYLINQERNGYYFPTVIYVHENTVRPIVQTTNDKYTIATTHMTIA